MNLLNNKFKFKALFLVLLAACSNQVDDTVDVEDAITTDVQNTTTTTTQQKNTNWFPEDLTEEEISNLSEQNKLYYFCYPDPTVEECEYEYDGVSLLLWDIGAPFWIEQIAKIQNWSQDYGNPGSERWGEYPQELKDILSSPAFKISDNDDIYDCFLSVPGSTGGRMMGVLGIYPAPLELIRDGLFNYEPRQDWECYPENELQTYNNTSHKGSGSPLLRGDFGNNLPDPRNASWFMWGHRTSYHPISPNNDFPNIIPEEFEITEFYWWWVEGFSIEQFCEKGTSAFTYEEDYDSVCG